MPIGKFLWRKPAERVTGRTIYMTIFKSIHAFLFNRRLKQRMIILYAVFSLIIIGLLAGYTYRYLFNSLKTKEQGILWDSLTYKAEQITGRLALQNDALLEVFTDVAFQDLYVRQQNISSQSEEWILLENDYREYFNTIRWRYTDVLDSILLVSSEQGAFSDNNNPIWMYQYYTGSLCNERAMETKNRIQYIPHGIRQDTFSILRSFYYTAETSTVGTALNPGYLSEDDGDYSTLIFNIKKKYFKNLLNEEATKRDALVAIVSVRDGIVVGSDGFDADGGWGQQLARQHDVESGFYEMNGGGTSLWYLSRDLGYGDWKLVYLYDKQLLYEKAGHIRIVSAEIFFAALLLFMVVASIVADSVVKPIKDLGDYMDEVLDHNLDQQYIPKYNDEIADLSSNFNAMMFRISELVQNIRVVEKQKRQEEMKALQAQINPHFLYNTLDTVYWLAKMDDNEEVASMIADLASFFRLSLNKGKEWTTVEREVEHAATYLRIQRKRFYGGFDFHIEIDDDVRRMKVPKLILQPIVENTLLHGFEGITRQGVIRIYARQEEERLTFTVVDNGIGMDKQMVQWLNIKRHFKQSDNDSKGESQNNSGYALRNIRERIELYAGSKYGLTIESEENEGTQVILSFPLGDFMKGDVGDDETADC